MSSDPLPQQVFDRSHFEGRIRAPSGKGEHVDHIERVAEVALARAPATLDFETWQKRYWSRVPQHAQHEALAEQLSQLFVASLALVPCLPPEAFELLVSESPPHQLWSYISASESRELQATVLKGFQRTQHTLRNPAVRKRLLRWLPEHADDAYLLVLIWALAVPLRPVAQAALLLPIGAEWRSSLAGLKRPHGRLAALAAAAFAGRREPFAALLEVGPNESPEPELQPDANWGVHDEALPPPAGAKPIAEPNAIEELTQHHREEMESAKAVIEQLEARARLHDVEIQRLRAGAQTTIEGAERKLEQMRARHESEVAEIKKVAARGERKFNAAEREIKEAKEEARKLKKQVAHLQTLLEEERRRAAALVAAAHNPSPPPPSEQTTAPTPLWPAAESVVHRPATIRQVAPIDELFEWSADGRPVKLTPRQVAARIEANDEEAVATLTQALESLEAADKNMHQKFLHRLRAIDNYYAQVLTRSTKRVLIDASNVARSAPNQHGKGQLKHLLDVRAELRRRGCFPIIFYADATLPYFIDDPHKLRAMVRSGAVLTSTTGQEADELLAREARRSGASVVTNDRRFWTKVSPDYEPQRISFRVYDDTIVLDDA